MKAWATGKGSFNTREAKIIPRMILKGDLRMTAVLQALGKQSILDMTQWKDRRRLTSQR